MNARLALKENDRIIQGIIERAKRVMKVKSMTYQEALDYGEAVDLKFATTEGQKASIEIRYSGIKNK